MKKKLAVLAAGMMIVSMAVSGCGSSSSSSASGSSASSAKAEGGASGITVRLATGGTSGTYYAYGGVVGQVLSEATGAKFDVQSTGASKANIGLVADGEVDMAIVQNDVMDYAYNGTDLFDGEKTDNFSSMAACYAEVCQVIANPSAGIETIADLKGKRVSVGDAGSGVEFNAKQILAAYGVTFDDIDKQNLSFADSANAMKDNKIDAFFCTAGAPTTAVMELASTNNIKVLNVDGAEAEKLVADYPFYTAYTIPKDTYKGMEEDAQTVAVKATLIVSNKLSDDAVYELTKALFENKADIEAGHAKGAELDTQYAVEGVSVPFHPGAEKYFKEAGVLE
ncbi:TAXI family TRAP transporter solute-binding subunit [Lachnospiraceae bacterium NSJ-143]|nr:TAXI family TRAP transporter solute-binding subunit [Lachnospiraceae bacterium NSJ-143]